MLDEMFSEDNIYLGVDGNNFFEVLNNVSKELNKKKYINDGYIESVIEREKIFPTGLEFPKYCIAIPHTDSKYIKKDAIAIVKPKQSVIFRDMATNSKDLEVNIFLLLLISKNENQVKVLSSVIKNFSDEDFYNKIILIACGAGIATSTIVVSRVEELIKKHNLDVDIKQIKIAEAAGLQNEADLIVSTTILPTTYSIPSIIATNYIMGIGEEELDEEILNHLR